SRRRHTRCLSDWSSDVCSSDLQMLAPTVPTRLVLHLLVGAVALLSAQAITGASTMTTTLLLGEAQVAHAEQSTGATSSISAPAQIGRASCRERGQVQGGASCDR